MDPVSLTPVVFSLVLPYLQKIAEKAVESLPEAVGKVWDVVKEKMTTKPETASLPADLEKTPDSAVVQGAFQYQLEKLLANDDAFAKQLAELVEVAKNQQGGSTAPAVLRARAGDTLAQLGDPRFNADLWHLPTDENFGFVRIPAGMFLMGSDDKDKQAEDREKPQHEVELPEYWMAKYPVTVAQYRTFVENSSYKTNDERALQGNLNHPVVNVTWYDALEYSKWLDSELRKVAQEKVGAGEKHSFWQELAEGKLGVTLPSEAEWEKAARWNPSPNGRGQGEGVSYIYPWGDEFDPEKANTDHTGIGTTSSVGCFPAWGHGLYDMSGNVWEWTRSILGRWEKSGHKIIFGYPYNGSDGREDLVASKDFTRGLRGGSFYDQSGNARCAYRGGGSPDYWDWDFGFRAVVSPVLPS